MSYRSFKRVLGETSLERKCRILFGASLLVLIAASFFWYGWLTESIVWKQNQLNGRQSVDEIIAKVHWKKLETNENFAAEVLPRLVNPADGVIFEVDEKANTVKIRRYLTVRGFVKLEPQMTLDVYDPIADVTTDPRKGQIEITKVFGQDEALATIIEPRPGTRQPQSSSDPDVPKAKPADRQEKPNQPKSKSNEPKPIQANDIIVAPHIRYTWEPIRPAANAFKGKGLAKNPFEERLLEQFNRLPTNPSESSRTSFAEGQGRDKEYNYYQPIYAGATCVDCHRVNWGNAGLMENDLLSIIHVRLPTKETHNAINWNRAMLAAIAIITVFLAMVALYVIVRYVIVKPLKHLRDVSDEISRGNIAQRADIHTGDEFEDLAVSFNRMLQKVLDASQELRHLNDDLDAKVDELAQANMQLFEMNRLKSDFLATMSHELRTPLNSIIGFSDVLDSIDSLDTKQRRYVQNIQKSGRLLLEMINDILDLAKIESGKMELNLTRFRIDPVITAQCDMARPLAEKKSIDVTTDIEPGIPELYQDQSKLQQILNNLLSNAIKFTPEGGRVDVLARAARDRLELVVRDTGVGIAEADQTVIFEKFRQGRTALAGGDAMTREYSGTGLGLSIVKELCKLLGGEITLESQLGKGSTFAVRIPMTRDEQPRLDSPLASELDELANPRPDFHRLREEAVPSASQASES